MKKSMFVSMLTMLTICLLAAMPALADIQILRPNGPGEDLSGQTCPNGNAVSPFETQFPASGEHRDKVEDDPDHDGDATYVESEGDCNKDLYHLEDPTFDDVDIINKVTLIAVFRSANTSQRNGFFGLKSGDTEAWGDRVILCDETGCDTPYTLYSREYPGNPAGGDWTKADIEALQVGFFADNETKSGLRATQIYVEVDYTPLEDLVIRPNGAGDTPVGPSSSNHNGVGTCASPEDTSGLTGAGMALGNWDRVNDVTSDDDTTYVETSGDDNGELYNLEDVTLHGATIHGIELCTVMRRATTSQREGFFGLKTNGRENWGSANSGSCPSGAAPTSVGAEPNRVNWPGSGSANNTAYAEYCATYLTNPATGSAWTEAHINALQVGFFSRNTTASGFRATQIYVIVDITP